MPSSTSSSVHGALMLSLGLAGVFAPSLLEQLFALLASFVGVASTLSGAAVTLFGLTSIGYGVSHLHAAGGSDKAAVGVLCSSSSIAIAAAAAAVLQVRAVAI